MKFCCTLIVVFCVFSLFADWIQVSENTQQELFEINPIASKTMELQFVLDGYESEEITINNQEYTKISYQNEGQILEIGKPDLPVFTRFLTIPVEGNVTYEIIQSDHIIISDVNVFPQQNLRSESKPANSEFVINESFYQSKKVFPDELVKIGTPAIMRDFRIVDLSVYPFQFDPEKKELKVYKNLKIKIKFSPDEGDNQKTRIGKISRFFRNTNSSIIINNDLSDLRDEEFQIPSYLFIYPDNQVVESKIQPLLDWKHQKGFEVIAANTSQTGTTMTSIKNYIQNAYDTWENPPEFICLVGDAGGNFNIPTAHYAGGEGDHFYTLLEGDDILSDAFIGRLSFNSIFELETIVTKILLYEKEPYLDETDWYNKIVLVGDPTTSGQSCVNTKISIKEMIEEHFNNFDFVEIYSSPWQSQMFEGLDNGASYFNYRGYYEMSGWMNGYTNSLSNDFKLPVAVILTCNTGNFEGTTDCKSECFLKTGTPSSPTGAIAAIGTATLDTNTCFNNCVDSGIFYGIFAENIFHLGGALNRGKLNLSLSYPTNPINAIEKFSYWNNLMGDPGLEIWTGIPLEMTVQYNSQIPLGSNNLEVTVWDNFGFPVSDAWVTFLLGNDEIFSTGFTDDNGQVILPVNADMIGIANLTVTKHDFIPHLGSVDIVQLDVALIVSETNIDDDESGESSGNGDGFINPSENIEMGISLFNSGLSVANSVSATLSTENEMITINDNYEFYGSIEPGNASFSNDDFDFFVDPSLTGGKTINFNITITDESGQQWRDYLSFTVEGALLNVFSHTVIDDDEILDPGESAEFLITLQNNGSVDISDVYGILSCSEMNISIDDQEGFFGDIPSGEQASNNENRFVLSADDCVIDGININLDLQLFNADGYNDLQNLILQVGNSTINDPLGPDESGYYCYDDEDIDYEQAPVYSWIEIDPNYGGNGTILSMYDNGDMGDHENVNIPFNFRFYNRNYSSLTICSNGWLCPGLSNSNSFMNWRIPGSTGPNPMIAPFWDDLKIGNGRVCYYYDSDQNFFIVEWSLLQNDFDNSEETFQVILKDREYYPTTSGNNEILFQYKTMNNTDQGDYGNYSNHGEYATVGIADHSGTIGLEYSYRNQYPETAKPLENEMAILFTGLPIPNESSFIILDSYEFDDSEANNNGNINPGETIFLQLFLNNIGNEIGNNITASISTTDNFINITEHTAFIESLLPGEIEGIFYAFEVLPLCPDKRLIEIDILILSDNNNDWLNTFAFEVLAPEIEVSDDVLDFGEVFYDFPGSLTFSVTNTGSELLEVSNIYTNNESIDIDQQIFNLDHDESQNVNMIINSDQTGFISDTLYIVSNDPDESLYSVTIYAEILLPPHIDVTPQSLSITMSQNEINTQSIIISNFGESDLIFTSELTEYTFTGNALNLDGYNDYLSLPEPVVTTEYFTLEMWGNMQGEGGGSNICNPIFEQRDNDGSNSQCLIVLFTEYYTDIVKFIIRSSSQINSILVSEPIPYNVWNHFAAVVAPDSIFLYINGNMVDSALNIQEGNYTTNAINVDIGCHNYSGYVHSFYNGFVDDVRIWDHPRSHEEILNSMNQTLSGHEHGLEAYWNFDEENPWLDHSGNGFDGIPHGDVSTIESTVPIIDWLSFTTDSAVLSAGSTVDLELIFDSYNLDLGEYTADIQINSNDPDLAEVHIPVLLEISEQSADEIDLSETELFGNFPNPFNQFTTISFNINNKELKESKISIFNIKGQRIKTIPVIVSEVGVSKGDDGSILWNGKDQNGKLVSSGIYFYKLQTDNYSNTKKMILMRY